jgi:tRNA-2-methylthio-N6-dimethylallyladenosine synthase
MDDDLIAAHGDCDKLMPYLHLPVQAGSDRVLKAMNRKHTGESYIRLIERIRAARPDLALSGDFIVGFPGETEADFQATLDLVEEVGYGQRLFVQVFPRPGTPAAERAQVDPSEADDRLQRLQALLTTQQRAAQDAMVGREVSVLFEKPGRLPGQMVGKSEYLHAVHVQGPADLTGRIAAVDIVESGPNSLAGCAAVNAEPRSPQHQELFVTSDTICCVAPAGLPTSARRMRLTPGAHFGDHHSAANRRRDTVRAASRTAA